MTYLMNRLAKYISISSVFTLIMVVSNSSIAAMSGDVITIREDAPEQYIVVKGDTLWDISGRFLEKPWHWPQIWNINPQIEDPHWIYPGDIIGLEYVDGVPRITINGNIANTDLQTIKLSPQVRRDAIQGPVYAIDLDSISTLLSTNSIIPIEALENSPYLLEGRNTGIYSSSGDVVFARGDWSSEIISYEIVRPGREYLDQRTGKVFAVEGVLVGMATLLEQDGDQGTLAVDKSVIEVRKGDLFLPSVPGELDGSYFPEPPNFQVEAAVVGIESGHAIGGSDESLILNVGSIDNISVGHLLTIQKQDYEIQDDRVDLIPGGKKRNITFTGEKFARIFVYKVFEKNSLALVLNTDDVIRINDRVVNP